MDKFDLLARTEAFTLLRLATFAMGEASADLEDRHAKIALAYLVAVKAIAMAHPAVEDQIINRPEIAALSTFLRI